jgi:hypothetical protein
VDVLGNSLAPPQRVLLEAMIRFLAAIDGHPIVSRMGAFFLLHAHMGLTAAQVGEAVGRTDRAMRTVQALSAQELVDSVWRELGRRRTPKLLPEHAGPVAKYLAEHPHCTTEEVIGFIRDAFNISVERHALWRFSTMYNLGVLRGGSDGTRGGDGAPFSLGRTHVGGAFLLLPFALWLSAKAGKALSKRLGSKEKAQTGG